MTATTPRIDAEFELGGVLFATVHASAVHDCVGAHVDLDGNVLANGNLRPLVDPSDALGVAIAVRQEAFRAIRVAHEECGMEFGRTDSLAASAAIARALPLTPILEAQVEAEGRALVALLGGAA